MSDNIDENLKTLGKGFGGNGADGEAEASLLIERCYQYSTADEYLLKGPLAEVVYDDLDEDDKGQFDKLAVARKKLKHKRALRQEHA